MKLITTKHIHPVVFTDPFYDYSLPDSEHLVLCEAYAMMLLNITHPDDLPPRADLTLTTYIPNCNSYKIYKHYSGPFCSVPTLFAILDGPYFSGRSYQLVSVNNNSPKTPYISCYQPLLNILSSFPSTPFYLSLTPSES